MAEILQTAAAKTILWVAAGAALVVVGLYAIDRMRRGIREPDVRTHELIENFRELHQEGELSDGEYRTIRAMLSQRLLDEVSQKPGESNAAQSG